MTCTERRWHLADVWEAVADRFSSADALVHADRRLAWSEFESHANGIAATLLSEGLRRQDKVAQYLYNSPEYPESIFATFKGGLVPVNTNYRYGVDELTHLWTDADVVAVIFHGTFTETCARVRERLSTVRTWIWVDDGDGSCPPWAIPYEKAAGSHPERVEPPWDRRGDDLLLLYTGGTTGQPKGVMWPQERLFRFLELRAGRRIPDAVDAVAYAASLERAGPRVVPVAPLMHGTGLMSSLDTLNRAGCVITMAERRFDAERLLDVVSVEHASGLVIVGDAIARPLVDCLDNEPHRWGLECVRYVVSSGVMFSRNAKEDLLRHLPNAVVLDTLGSSETGAAARSTSHRTDASGTASFRLVDGAVIIGEDGRTVDEAGGGTGRVAVSGPIPLGYYNDPVKTAESFVSVDGTDFALTGDWAEYLGDGSIRLLGRGSGCINSGGEKIYAEEVEDAVKSHSPVADCVVVGIPDDRFGEIVVALVETVTGAELDEQAVIDHVRARIAPYKAPRRVLCVASVGRAHNGKVDHNELKARAAAMLGIPAPSRPS